MKRYPGGTESVTVRIPKDAVVDLEQFAEKFGQTKSDLVVEGVLAYLVRLKKEGR